MCPPSAGISYPEIYLGPLKDNELAKEQAEFIRKVMSQAYDAMTADIAMARGFGKDNIYNDPKYKRHINDERERAKAFV